MHLDKPFLLVGTPQSQGSAKVLHSRQTTPARSLFLFLKSLGLIGLGPTLEDSFNLNCLPKVSSPNTIERLSSHPLNTSQRGLNFNMGFGRDTQAIASFKYMIRTPNLH